MCFRNLEQHVNDAISLFGNKDARGIIIIRKFNDYYFGYFDANGIPQPGFKDIVEQLKEQYPLSELDIVGEQKKKDFIRLFGTCLRLMNILSSFDEFEWQKILSGRDLQDYMSRYQDTYQ